MNVLACPTFVAMEPVPIWTEVLNVIVQKDMLQDREEIVKMWMNALNMVINVLFGVIILQAHFVAYVLLDTK